MPDTPRTWPETCCADEGALDAWLERPWRTGEWRCHSDGHVLVAVPATGDEWEPPTSRAPHGRGTSKIHQILHSEPSDWPGLRTYELDFLREWAGPRLEECTDCTPEDREAGPCLDCNGMGLIDCVCSTCENEHGRTCPRCNGGGGVWCDTCELTGIVGDWNRRLGLIDEVGLNRRLLARMLQGAPGEVVAVTRQTNPHDSLILFGHGWRGLLSPLRRDVGDAAEWVDVPRLELEASNA